MKYDTAGNIVKERVICGCCNQDTAGNHEWNCSNKNVNSSPARALPAYPRHQQEKPSRVIAGLNHQSSDARGTTDILSTSSQETRTCVNGHTMTGIGFSDMCPECEGAWKPSQEWETMLEYALPERLTEEEKVIIRNNVSNLLSQSRYQARTAVLEEMREIAEKMKIPVRCLQHDLMGTCDFSHNQALDDLLEKLK